MLKIVVSFCLISIKKIFWAVSCRSLNFRRARLRNRAVTWNSFTIGTINLYDLLYRTKNLITDSFGIVSLIVLTFELVPFVTDRRGIKIPRQILNSSHNFDVFRKIFKGWMIKYNIITFWYNVRKYKSIGYRTSVIGIYTKSVKVFSFTIWPFPPGSMICNNWMTIGMLCTIPVRRSQSCAGQIGPFDVSVYS